MGNSLWRRVLFHGHRPARPDLPRLLAITASACDQLFFQTLQARGEWDVVIARSVREALALVISEQFHVAFFDRDLPGADWREGMSRIARSSPRTCFLLASGVSDEFLWREVVMHGGYDVVTTPLDDAVVARALQRAWYFWKATPPASTPAV